MLPAALALKLDPLIRRLATDHDGERLATLAALERVLRASDFAFHDLAGCVIASAEPLSVRDPTPFQPVPHAFIAVDALFDCSGLTAWEVNFLHSVGRQLCRHRRLTDKQHAALDRLWGKYQGRARMSAKVEVIEVRPVSNAGNLKALVTIKAGCFNIRGWRVIQQPGQRAWVSVPQEQGSDGRWHNRLEVTNPEVLEAIRRAILQAWEGRNEPRGLLSGRGRLRRAAIVERLSLCREVPAIRGGRGCLDASTDPETIAGWWRQYPAANIGIATGKASGFDAIDLDGEDGEDALAALVRQHGALPETVEQLTGGGGRHLLFRHIEGVGNRTAILPGIDVRAAQLLERLALAHNTAWASASAAWARPSSTVAINLGRQGAYRTHKG